MILTRTSLNHRASHAKLAKVAKQIVNSRDVHTLQNA